MDNQKGLKIYNGRVACPLCDGNGNIYKAYVVNLKMELYLCDECEATWKEEKLIGVQPIEDLSTFLEENGCTYNNADIIDLGYDWYDKNTE